MAPRMNETIMTKKKPMMRILKIIKSSNEAPEEGIRAGLPRGFFGQLCHDSGQSGAFLDFLPV